MAHRGTAVGPLRTILFTLACAAVPAGAAAQHLVAQPFATGLSFPTAFIADPTMANRHFVVEQNGRIRVLVNGVVQPTPFLDLTGPPTAISTGGERGLLGMALDPDYATNRRFYVYFTSADNPVTGATTGDLVVARFRRSVGDPLVADPASRFDLKWISLSGQAYIEHSQFGNHNGGSLMFGPDGYLYIGVGDGGSSHDPLNSGQGNDTLLGRMLRIDVDVSDADPEGYDIPLDNPFVGEPTLSLPESWSVGLRNPWKFSFDDPTRGGTGALFIADVGQNRWEEINWEPADSGARNYGWSILEGAHPPSGRPTPPPPAAFLPLTNPVYEYSHVAGESALQGASITGGFVYRGTNLSALWRGRYFFADFAARRVWSAAVNDGTGALSGIIDHTAGLGAPTVSSFGVDQSGELYVVGYGAINQGVIYRLCELTITRGQDGFWNTGGTGTLRIETQPDCNWSLAIDSPWILPLSGTSGTGSGTVVFRVLPSGNTLRHGSINVSGLPINIFQSNAAPIHGDLDVNASGDILWQHTDGRLAVWFMNNTMLVDGRPFGPGPLVDTAWQLVAAGDFDGDGGRDAVFQHQTDGRLAVWMMSQTVLLSGGPLTPAMVPDLNWKIRAAADIDRDGWTDLIWQHQGDGSIAVWLMTGTQLRDGRLLTPGAVADTNWRIIGAGDLNDDGHADLLWQHQTDGLISAWFMNGTSLVSGVLLSPGQVTDTNWKIRAVADMNGDRRLDLIWHNQSTGLMSIWLMNGIVRIGDGLHVTPSGVADTGWKIVGPK
jgi:glucose/arabinose dehydrogenase